METQFWDFLTEVLILLTAALAVGSLFERFRQSAILGYLVAGTVLGPHALHWVTSEELVNVMSELGVALLLFVIGLEFSLRRLMRIGPIGLIGGSLQVGGTLLLTAGICWAAGAALSAGVAIGAVVALSSTACVLRVLADRAEVDSVHGRGSLGILLLQDIAVVPLVLLVTMLAGSGTAWQMVWGLLKAMGLIAAMVGAFYVLSNYALPRLLHGPAMLRNRELPLLLTVVLALGSAWVAHSLKLSPALGAFVAGVMLAESPFATQIRADVGALKTLFVTLFFASIGMLGDPGWIVANLPAVAGVVALVLVGKAVIITAVASLVGYSLRYAVATGVCLAQIGEFSFVIVGAAWAAGTEGAGLIDEYTFRLFVSATIVTLLLTPYLVPAAPYVGRWVDAVLSRFGLRPPSAAAAELNQGHAVQRGHVIVIGYGPSGQRVAELLARRGITPLVIDLHPRNVTLAQANGYPALVGDATHGELLSHANLPEARGVAVALPDHRTALHLVQQVRLMAPAVPVVVRARYHAFAGDLEGAGATAVIDEEPLIGRRMGQTVARNLRPEPAARPAAPAPSA